MSRHLSTKWAVLRMRSCHFSLFGRLLQRVTTFPSVNNCNILYRYLNYYFVSIIFLIFVQAIHKALTKGGIDDERSDSESCADDNDDDVTEQKKEQ